MGEGIEPLSNVILNRRRMLGLAAASAAGAAFTVSMAAGKTTDPPLRPHRTSLLAAVEPTAPPSGLGYLSRYTPADCHRASDVTMAAGTKVVTSAGQAHFSTTAKVGQTILIGDDALTGFRSTITAVISDTEVAIAEAPTVPATNDLYRYAGAAWGTDAAPGLMTAFAELRARDGSAVVVDGHFLIGSEATLDFAVNSPNVRLLGNWSESSITAATGPNVHALRFVNANSVMINGLTFLGVQKHQGQADRLISVTSGRNAKIVDCLFGGAAASAGVLFFADTVAVIQDCFFGGCGANGAGGGVIRSYEGLGLHLRNVQMLDYLTGTGFSYGTTTQFTGQNPWVKVEEPGAAYLNRGTITLQQVYLDEAPFRCIEMQGGVNRLQPIVLDDVNVNVTYQAHGAGIYISKAVGVKMRNVAAGYRDDPLVLPGVHLLDAGVVELDRVRCMQSASEIRADGLTTSLTLIDCTYATLVAACPVSVETAGAGAVAMTKAGAISDADYPVPPRTGTMGIDTASGYLYVRLPGGWSRAALTAVSTTPVGTTNAAPGIPTGVTATPGPGSGEITVAWTEPASDGGSPLTGNRITPRIGGVAQTPIDVGKVSSSVVPGLTNGTSYTFTVAAINGVGVGAASAPSNAATPVAAPVSSGAAFVSSFTAGPTRTGSGVLFGYRFKVGRSALAVSSVGRINLPGSREPHTVKITRVSDNATVASAVITADGAGGFKYADVTPVVLVANTAYRIHSTENNDPLYDNVPGVSTAAGTIEASEYSTDGGANFTSVAGGSNVYGPCNFRHT